MAPQVPTWVERQDTVSGYVQPPVLLVDPDAGFISMKGRACQKVFLGVDFPLFKRIIKPIDVAKTGGLGHFDARHGLHQFSTSVQRQHLGDQNVDRQCLDAIAILQRPGMFSGKRLLVRAQHAGQSLISATTFNFLTVNLISSRTRCSRADGSMSERSVPQLSQASTVEISSTVTVSKFSPVIEFRAALVSRGFLGDFLVSSLPVCYGGMLEFLLVFLVFFSRKMTIRISNRRHNVVKTT